MNDRLPRELIARAATNRTRKRIKVDWWQVFIIVWYILIFCLGVALVIFGGVK